MKITFLQLILVFLGGGMGSVFRYLISKIMSNIVETNFPWGTFTVNMIGCFLIGVTLTALERYGFNPIWSLMIVTGFCGGLTTFSTFMYENTQLIKNSDYLLMLAYVFMSLFWGFASSFLGVFIVRRI